MNRPVILIGSSSKILDSKHGEAIDKFAHVIRFNAYQIKGYEKYVGTKEKIWAPNLGISQHKESTDKYLKRNESIWYVGSNYNLEKQLLITKKKLNRQFVIESINAGVADFINEIKDKFKDNNLCYEKGKIRTGKDIERFGIVYVHGFSFYQECEGSLKNSHYYAVDNVPDHMRKAFTEHPEREHDVNAENSIFRTLITLGWVRTLERI